MCVGIDKSGDDDFAGAVDLCDEFAMLLDPGIAKGVFSGSDGDDFAGDAEKSSVFSDAEFSEFMPAARA